MSEVPTADRVARHLHAHDAVAAQLGVRLVEADAGRASVSMTVRPDMCNGVGTCHGGIIFTLADCALEYASNSHDRLTVASVVSVDFVRPAVVGDELTAVCEERHRGRATGKYDVHVERADGRTIALLRAHGHEVGGPVIPTP